MVRVGVDFFGGGEECEEQTMPRKPRVECPGTMRHVMSRGDRREDILLGDTGRREEAVGQGYCGASAIRRSGSADFQLHPPLRDRMSTDGKIGDEWKTNHTMAAVKG